MTNGSIVKKSVVVYTSWFYLFHWLFTSSDTGGMHCSHTTGRWHAVGQLADFPPLSLICYIFGYRWDALESSDREMQSGRTAGRRPTAIFGWSHI